MRQLAFTSILILTCFSGASVMAQGEYAPLGKGGMIFSGGGSFGSESHLLGLSFGGQVNGQFDFTFHYGTGEASSASVEQYGFLCSAFLGRSRARSNVFTALRIAIDQVTTGSTNTWFGPRGGGEKTVYTPSVSLIWLTNAKDKAGTIVVPSTSVGGHLAKSQDSQIFTQLAMAIRNLSGKGSVFYIEPGLGSFKLGNETKVQVFVSIGFIPRL